MAKAPQAPWMTAELGPLKFLIFDAKRKAADLCREATTFVWLRNGINNEYTKSTRPQWSGGWSRYTERRAGKSRGTTLDLSIKKMKQRASMLQREQRRQNLTAKVITYRPPSRVLKKLSEMLAT